MTILFLSHEDDKVMGSTLSLANMIHSLQKLGCEAIVTLPGKGLAKEYLEAKGIRCIVAKYHVDFVGRGSRAWQLLSLPYRVARDNCDNKKAINSIISQLGDTKIDIVHTNTAVLDFGQKLAQKLHAPHVWHLREFIDQDMGFRPFLGWKHLRREIKQADATISITKAIAKHYSVFGNANSYVLFDAVRSQENLICKEEKLPQFIFCGQLTPHKGPDIAIKTFCQFAEIHPEYKLLLLGTAIDSIYVEYLHQLVPEALRNHVTFMGYVANPDPIIAESTALLMCSRNEAQGRVTIEAMLQGCPVIAMNAGGTREIITESKTGWLYNTEEELLSKMEAIISQPSETQRIAKEAKAFAEDNFLEENYGPKILKIYKQLCQN